MVAEDCCERRMSRRRPHYKQAECKADARKGCESERPEGRADARDLAKMEDRDDDTAGSQPRLEALGLAGRCISFLHIGTVARHLPLPDLFV